MSMKNQILCKKVKRWLSHDYPPPTDTNMTGKEDPNTGDEASFTEGSFTEGSCDGDVTDEKTDGGTEMTDGGANDGGVTDGGGTDGENDMK